jgi:protocatechuate 3,4-dioxygenase beta subunit
MMPTDRNRFSRREVLEVFGAAGLAMAAGYTSSSPASPTDTSASSGTTTPAGGATSCSVTPEETAGPYPDRVGMINNPAFFRQDITEGRSGLPVTLALTVMNVSSSCSPVANAQIEIWQCDAEGRYSEYSQPGYNGTGQTFLRGLQTTDGEGRATFRTIYPGWYAGRATHIHVEVFVGGRTVKTTQIAFPESASRAVYGTGVYASHGQNPTTNAGDNVFSDGSDAEMATLAGDATSGFTASLTIGVSV